MMFVFGYNWLGWSPDMMVMVMMMMKLPILMCAKNQKPSLVYRTENHELTPISTGPISQGSQSSALETYGDI